MIRIYNTLSGKKEALKPRSPKKLDLFVCGITPYDLPHIGNARTYVVFDAFVKFLRARDFKVTYVQNVTDVDDKIIAKAKAEKSAAQQVAAKYEKAYRESMKALGVNSVDTYARATDHIQEIISQVKRLLKGGFAYEIKNDGIYFDIAAFEGYGKLSHRTKLQAEDAVSRIDSSAKKKNKGDFALWKRSKKGEPMWNSPWGKGRPGWHIEDTAITEKNFGAQYDIHGGARDLIFPHHEAEIAQMEAISQKSPLARHWMHPGFLTVRGRKMSKSLGNFVTIEGFLKHHSARLFRLLALKTHYRSAINYSEKLLEQTERELQRFDEFAGNVKHADGKGRFAVKAFRTKFQKALEDDFNTPEALAVLFMMMTEANKKLSQDAFTKKTQNDILSFLKEADAVFGFLSLKPGKSHAVPSAIQDLAEKREELRARKEWKKADKVRKTIEEKGWIVQDGPDGPRIRSNS